MKNFDKATDKVVEKGFISKEKILEYVTEEDIFQLVFGFKPLEFDYITSPFREDKNPGCWFETDITNGKLKFRDFAYGTKPLDCFDAVQDYFKIPNFYKTLEFIKDKLIDGKSVKHDIKHIKPSIKLPTKTKRKVEIYIGTRDFNVRDKKYWSKYEISKKDLIGDKVFPVQKFKITNTKSGDFMTRTYDVCYAYTEFEKGRKKLYRPFQKGKHRFLTNCKADDVGGVKKLVPFGRQLVITKSYKDFRVLKNQGLNVIWFQNEGMFPNNTYLYSLCERFKKVVVFFDNDNAGHEASDKLLELINFKFPNKCSKVSLPVNFPEKTDIKDPADLISKKGKQSLIKFLKENKLVL